LSSAAVKDNFQISSGNGTSNLTNFRNEFVTPEPMTMALFGSGLLALGLVRRFRRS
jgi:hypothetical protein